LQIKPKLLTNGANGYEASDELTPVQTAKIQPPIVNNPIRSIPSKPPLPTNTTTNHLGSRVENNSAMQHSFYDNVDLQTEQEKQQQKRFVSRFGRQPQQKVALKASEDQTTPPPTDPIQPKQLGGRKESSDSMFSNTSRDSIFSITSMKSDIKLRRNFNY
jgi:hypothetical protein